MCTRACFLSGKQVQGRDRPRKRGPLFHYEFMRIGEDYEDIVYDCSSCADMILRVDRNAYVDI
jgi:hypothetical protein